MSDKVEYYKMYFRLVRHFNDSRASYFLAYKAVEKWHKKKYGVMMYSSYASFRVGKSKLNRKN
jgi:hypothetical protein